MEAKKPIRSLKSMLFKYFWVMMILSIVEILITIGLVIVANLTQSKALLIVVAIAIPVTVTLLLGALFYFSGKLYKLVFEQAFEISKRNFEALVNFDKDFEYSPRNDIEEIRDMNRSFKEISRKFEGITVFSQKSYKDIPLEYVDENNKNVVSEKSLLGNIKELIIANESYRNALIDIAYDIGDESISEKDRASIIKYLTRGLNYDQMLIAQKSINPGFYVYVPAIDSVSQLQEEIKSLLKNISLIRRTVNGRQLIIATVNVVIYPYSNIDHILEDLKHATRQRKTFNLYIPEREIEGNKKMLMSSMNVNATTRLIEDLQSINANPKEFVSNTKKIQTAIANISNYYGFSCGGYIDFDSEKDGYYSRFVHSDTGSIVFRPQVRVNRTFVQILANIQDTDHTYYFSSRKHVNDEFGKFIDEYRCKSGIFYVLMRNEACMGLIYFLNKTNELTLDAYMKSSLLSCCHSLGNVYKEMEIRRQRDESVKNFNNLVRVTDITLYSINRETYEITYSSEAFQKTCPKAVIGAKCYEAIHGLSEPCKKCPLKNGKHLIQEYNNQKFEVYEVLKNSKELATVLWKPNDMGIIKEWFDDETQLMTYYAFIHALQNQYLMKKNGNIMLVAMKHIKDFLEVSGNKGFVNFLTTLFDKLTEEYKYPLDIYMYDKNTLAIVMPESKDEDITRLAENISEITKGLALENLTFTYVNKAYPAKEDTIEKLISAVDKVAKERYELADDELLMIDTNYKRSASREGYIYETVVNAFEKGKFSLNYQPVIDNKDRLIRGVELLLLIKDAETGNPINIGQAMEIAFERGFTPVIASSILDYIDKLLKHYGYTFFLSTGLGRLSINADYGFFKDGTYETRLAEIVEKHKLPAGFISFEVPESDASMYREEYAVISKKLEAINSLLVCDRYDGEFITPEEAVQAGMKEIKVSRNLVLAIEDRDTNDKIMKMWEDAAKAGLKVTFVGVENRTISDSIFLEGHECNVQGNFFYPPMDEDTMFETVRQRNMKDKDNNM